MSYTKDHFSRGDRIYVTADHLLVKGQKGTVDRWVHDMVFVVDMDNGRRIVLKDNEMQNITNREDS